MAHTRRHRKSSKKGLFGYVYGPVGQTIKAADNVTRATANTLRDVISTGLHGVERIGSKVTSRADKAIRGLLPKRKGKSKTRKANKSNKRR